MVPVRPAGQGPEQDRTDREIVMGQRILVVDDEPLIAMEIESTLSQAGFEVAHMAQSVETALAFLQDGVNVDGAVLDANLHDASARPVVDRLQEMGIPLLIVSGYSADQIGPWAENVKLLRKPIIYSELIKSLKQIATGPA
ncbi:response regulator [Aquisalinus flavus]|nr:response regulator [Aquisalinus flavus]